MPTEANRLLKILGLEEKRNALSKNLSGGMKRKLSVAIALIGGSEVCKQCKVYCITWVTQRW